MIHIEVSAPVYPTENPEKVIKAVSALFTDMKIERKVIENTAAETGVSPSLFLSGEGGLDLLVTLHGLIRREEIIDSIRNKVFNKGLSFDKPLLKTLLRILSIISSLRMSPCRVTRRSSPPSPERNKEGETPVSAAVFSITFLSIFMSVKRAETALITFSGFSVGYTGAETSMCIINLLQ